MSYLIIVFIFGLFWGSFLNVLIERLANNETILGRSRCDVCKVVLGFFDLWPIISFCVFFGRCRYCKHPISRQHLLVELLTASIFTAGAWHLKNLGVNEPLVLLRDFILISGLIVIGIQDYKYMIIMDAVIYAVGIPVLLLNLFIGYSLMSLFGATALLIVFFGAQYVISRGRWLGAGDIWLGGLLGVSFAFNALNVIVWGYALGAMIGIALLVLKKKELTSQMPLGTFLSTAGILYLLIK